MQLIFARFRQLSYNKWTGNYGTDVVKEKLTQSLKSLTQDCKAFEEELLNDKRLEEEATEDLTSVGAITPKSNRSKLKWKKRN